MKKIILLPVLLAAALLAGCKATNVGVNVPANTFKASIAGQPVEGSFPKDAKIGKLKITNDVTMTNGTHSATSIEITDLDTRNNPDVITMTGEAYVKMRTADTSHDTQVIKAGADAAGTVGGAAASAAAGKP